MAPAMVATGGGGGPGLFTNSNPLDRKIVPDDPGEREVFKVVYVVLESQYQASLSAACKRINAGRCDLVTFGRPFIANPDLPERFRQHAE